MENLQEKYNQGIEFRDKLMKDLADKNINPIKRLLGNILLDVTNRELDEINQKLTNNTTNIAEDFADDIDNISYSIDKCNCCDEEYILETHTNSKGETTEEKPFDFENSSPADIFKMGFNSCANNTKNEDTNIGIQFPDGNKLLIQVFSEGGINVEVKTTTDKAWRPPVLSEFELSVKNSDVFDSEDKLIA